MVAYALLALQGHTPRKIPQSFPPVMCDFWPLLT